MGVHMFYKEGPEGRLNRQLMLAKTPLRTFASLASETSRNYLVVIVASFRVYIESIIHTLDISSCTMNVLDFKWMHVDDCSFCREISCMHCPRRIQSDEKNGDSDNELTSQNAMPRMLEEEEC